METLFGLPMDGVMIYMLAILAFVLIGVGILAIRKPILARLALRNIPRRRSQTTLIVLGLMLATLLITAAFGTGDTMTYSMRQAFTASLGGTDIQVERINPVVALNGPPDFNRPVPTFPSTVYDDIRAKMGDDTRIDGWSTSFTQVGPVINVTKKQGSGQTFITGIGPDYITTQGALKTPDGQVFDIGTLGRDEIIVDEAASDKLDARAGDTLRLVYQGRTAELRVKGVIENSGVTNQFPVTLVNLGRMQELYGAPGQITQVNISLKGGNLEGLPLSGEVSDKLRGIVDAGQYNIAQVKKDGIDTANLIGNLFTTIFIFAALFSIASGVLLIFLIFTMLAAERKSEMGMARAVGTQRGHLTQMFIFEGLAYDLGAAAVGAALGVGVAFLMVGIVASIFGTFGFNITPHVELRSIIVAYCLGMLITFLTVTISAARVSRLNIVSAIRDIPDMPPSPKTLRQLAMEPFNRLGAMQPMGCVGAIFSLIFSLFRSGPVTATLGVLLFVLGWATSNAFFFHLGASLTLIALGLTVRWLLQGRGVRPARRDRIAFTLAGVLLLVYWLLPIDILHDWIGAPEFGNDGITNILFVGGLMSVLAAVWVVMYNADIMLRGLSLVLGRVGRMRPVLKTAIAYPMSSIFRTGMAIAMFALIMFVLVLMSVLTRVNQQVDPNKPDVSGGYDIEAKVSFNNPIPDLRERVSADPQLKDTFSSVAGQTLFPMEMRQPDGKPPAIPISEEMLKLQPSLKEGWRFYNTRLLDEQFARDNNFPLAIRAKGYESDRAVWDAMLKDPSLVVVDATPIILGETGGGFGPLILTISGVSLSDTTMNPVPLEVRLPGVPNAGVAKVKVIGVLTRFSNFYTGLYVNKAITSQLMAGAAPGGSIPGFSGELPTTSYFFRVAPQADPAAMQAAISTARRTLGSTFVNEGLEPLVIGDEIRRSLALGNGLNGLLQGFLALGLLVGVAALGVISTRAVVERRQQIGVLRAIGYQRNMISSSFILEASFIALMGILIGVVLGLAMSFNMVSFIQKDTPQVQFNIPWLEIGGIVLLAYLISLVTTILPARAASKIYPAEALRYSG